MLSPAIEADFQLEESQEMVGAIDTSQHTNDAAG